MSSIRQMSPHEFARLLDTYGPPLVIYARQWCVTPEDVVQDAFLKLIRIQPSPREPVPWLYRVVRNGAIDAAKTSRRRRRRETGAARPESWFVEPSIDGLDAESAIQALQKLPLEQREIIVAHLWGGLSFEQIAHVAGCSASSAFRRFSAGIEMLRAELGGLCESRSSKA
jgi:RNA polymerase sigma factor (sigma-70 family)